MTSNGRRRPFLERTIRADVSGVDVQQLVVLASRLPGTVTDFDGTTLTAIVDNCRRAEELIARYGGRILACGV